MFDIGTPQSALDHSRALRALLQEGGAYCAELTLPAFFAPQGGAWSPADHVRHLRKVTAAITVAYWLPGWALAGGFGTPAAPSRPYAAVRDNYRLALAKNASAGLFAPRPHPVPRDPAHRRRHILRAWERAGHRFIRALGQWPETRLDQFQVPHPRLGRLTLREMASFVVYHTAHHLARIAERAEAGLAARGS